MENLYLSFIDYKRGFNKIRREMLVGILRNLDLHGKAIQAIYKLYREEKDVMRIANEFSEYIYIQKKCALSNRMHLI